LRPFCMHLRSCELISFFDSKDGNTSLRLKLTLCTFVCWSS